MGFGSLADTPLWELWCESVSGFCYQKGSPLDIESIFQLGERCLHTNAPTLHILHLDTETPQLQHSPTPPTAQPSQTTPTCQTCRIHPPLILHLFAARKIMLDKLPHSCHNTPVFSLFSDFKLFHENFLLKANCP